MMAEMTVGDKGLEEQIRFGRGYISIHEPCCGAGSILIGALKAVKKAGYNYQQNVFAFAQDIDVCCVHMCYTQLSLLGVPAQVVHGNALTVETWAVWSTPFFVLNGWHRRLERDRALEAE